MAEVIVGNFITRLELPVERVINGAVEADLASVVILGVTKDGYEYFASSSPDGANVLWALERAKHKLMQIID